MSSDQVSKRATVQCCENPLTDVKILQRVLSYNGTGYWLFIAQVSKAWRLAYLQTKQRRIASQLMDDGQVQTFNCTPRMTLCSAVFSSLAGLRLAHSCGLRLRRLKKNSRQRKRQRSQNELSSHHKIQYLAGMFSDITVLVLAHELGLRMSSHVARGAATSDRVTSLQWLHDERHSHGHRGVSKAAAKSGSVASLTWLKQHGEQFSALTARAAAAAGHLHVLEYLFREGCAPDRRCSELAAEQGHLAVLQWLRAHDCPWDKDTIASFAARSGRYSVMKWLQQQPDISLSVRTVTAAARAGKISMCKYLLEQQCPCDDSVCEAAAANGHLNVLRWLHEKGGYSCAAKSVSLAAARSGSIKVMQYTLKECQRWSWTPVLTSDMLNVAGVYGQLEAAEWLRSQGAKWPDVLNKYGKQWPGVTLMWARSKGCTSPITSTT
jgi:hypothetical protein